MLKLEMTKQAGKFLAALPPKPKRQIAERIQRLRTNPLAADCLPLRGYAPFYRADSGEYRIVYRVVNEEKLLLVAIIGKRNDDHVYRLLRRKY